MGSPRSAPKELPRGPGDPHGAPIPSERYLEILRRAALHPEAAVVVHAPPVRWRWSVAGEDLGPAAEPWLEVVYDLTHGTLVMGYLASSLEAITLWPNRVWLRQNPRLGS